MKRHADSAAVSVVLLLMVTACARSPNEGAVAEATAAAWTSLLPSTGDELRGWSVLAGGADFRLEASEAGPVIVGVAADAERNTFLVTEQSYGDFELELEFLPDEELNSGVQFRSGVRSTEGGQEQVYGYQAEIDPSSRAWSAGIYDEARRGWLYPLTLHPEARSALRLGEWNRLRVRAVGPEVRTWLNDQPAAHLVDDGPGTERGFVALQVHAAPEEQHGREMRWRKIRIRELSPDAIYSGEDAVPYVVNTRLNDLSAAERQGGWQLLFDGESSAGWRGAHAETFPDSGWKIEDGVLSVLGTTGGEAAGGGDIVSESEFGAFELQLEFRLSEGANSGIKYFVTEDYASTGSAIGVEYQLLDDERHPDAKMGRDGNRTLASLYDLITADKQARFVRAPGEWNHARLRVTPDRRVEHWLNHQPVLRYTLGAPEFLELVAISKYRDWEGFGLWTAGHLLLQDHGDDVSFRSIKVRDLGALEPVPGEEVLP